MVVFLNEMMHLVTHPSSKIGYMLCVHLKTQLRHGKTFVVSLEIWITLLTIPMIYLLNLSTAGYIRRRKTFVLTKYLHTHTAGEFPLSFIPNQC